MTSAERNALILLLEIVHMTLVLLQRVPFGVSVDAKEKATVQLKRVDVALRDLADEERKRA